MWGLTTALCLLAQTNAFEHFDNRAQLTSYAGYDVVEHQSGNSHRKTHISKKGNARLRAALHLLSLVAPKYFPEIEQLFERVYDRTKMKMKAYVAVQRKLVTLAYTLCENEMDFDPQYQQNVTQNENNTNNTATSQRVNIPVNKNVDTAQKPCLYPA